MTAQPPQTISIRVRYAETDKMGVVYHANYFMWFEIGRCELLRAVGRSYRDMEAAGIGLPVIEATERAPSLMASAAMCVCASIRPGETNFPVPS